MSRHLHRARLCQSRARHNDVGICMGARPSSVSGALLRPASTPSLSLCPRDLLLCVLRLLSQRTDGAWSLLRQDLNDSLLVVVACIGFHTCTSCTLQGEAVCKCAPRRPKNKKKTSMAQMSIRTEKAFEKNGQRERVTNDPCPPSEQNTTTADVFVQWRWRLTQTSISSQSINLGSCENLLKK